MDYREALLLLLVVCSYASEMSVYREDHLSDCNWLNSAEGEKWNGKDQFGPFQTKVKKDLTMNDTLDGILPFVPFKNDRRMLLRASNLVLRDVDENKEDIIRLIKFNQTDVITYEGRNFVFDDLYIDSRVSSHIYIHANVCVCSIIVLIITKN